MTLDDDELARWSAAVRRAREEYVRAPFAEPQLNAERDLTRGQIDVARHRSDVRAYRDEKIARLSARGWPAEQIAREVDVTPDHVRRILHELRSA